MKFAQGVPMTKTGKLVDILKKHGDLPIDNICMEAELAVSKVSPILLNLELSGIVKSLPGKVYTLVSE